MRRAHALVDIARRPAPWRRLTILSPTPTTPQSPRSPSHRHPSHSKLFGETRTPLRSSTTDRTCVPLISTLSYDMPWFRRRSPGPAPHDAIANSNLDLAHAKWPASRSPHIAHRLRVCVLSTSDSRSRHAQPPWDSHAHGTRRHLYATQRTHAQGADNTYARRQTTLPRTRRHYSDNRPALAPSRRLVISSPRAILSRTNTNRENEHYDMEQAHRTAAPPAPSLHPSVHTRTNPNPHAALE